MNEQQKVPLFNPPVPNTSTRAHQVIDVNMKFAFNLYAWPTAAAGLLAGTTQTVRITMDGDYDFIWLSTQGYTTTTAAPPVLIANPWIGFQVRLNTGRYLNNNLFLWSSVVGTGQLPYYLPYPVRIPRTTFLDIDFTSFDTVAEVIYLCLDGYKIIQ